MDTDHYIEFPRRDPKAGGGTESINVDEKAIKVNNRWIVLYVRELLQKFHCHVNVAKCVSSVSL